MAERQDKFTVVDIATPHSEVGCEDQETPFPRRRRVGGSSSMSVSSIELDHESEAFSRALATAMMTMRRERKRSLKQTVTAKAATDTEQKVALDFASACEKLEKVAIDEATIVPAKMEGVVEAHQQEPVVDAREERWWIHQPTSVVLQQYRWPKKHYYCESCRTAWNCYNEVNGIQVYSSTGSAFRWGTSRNDVTAWECPDCFATYLKGAW